MNGRDGRTILVAAAVLLGASLLRHVVLRSSGDSLAPPDSAGILGELAEESRRAREEEKRRTRPLGEDERIDPNRAPAVELERLRGVGPAVAAAIVEDRKQRGPYRSVEELLRVRGIGPKTLERIAPHLELLPGRGRPVVGSARPGRDSDRRRITRPRRDDGRDTSAPVDLNRAGPAELEALPGIGPALAARIVAYRERRGSPFSRSEELLEVAGIGPKTLRAIREAGVRPP